MIGAIHVKKLGMDIIKNLIKIGVELVCFFQSYFLIGNYLLQNG
jgi:hypothetical protein